MTILTKIKAETQEVLERTNPSTFLTLFNNTLLVALFNYSKLCTLVSMVTGHDMAQAVLSGLSLRRPRITPRSADARFVVEWHWNRFFFKFFSCQ
jgi:hypothetical protein